MRKILYLTDLAYPAKGRNYAEEDIYRTDRLKERYDIVLCHPKCAAFEQDTDAVVFLKDMTDAIERTLNE